MTIPTLPVNWPQLCEEDLLRIVEVVDDQPAIVIPPSLPESKPGPWQFRNTIARNRARLLRHFDAAEIEYWVLPPNRPNNRDRSLGEQRDYFTAILTNLLFSVVQVATLPIRFIYHWTGYHRILRLENWLTRRAYVNADLHQSLVIDLEARDTEIIRRIDAFTEATGREPILITGLLDD